MAVNRFLNPVFNQYESQYVPVQLPYEAIMQQVQGKQQQQDARRQAAASMELQAQGLDKLQTHFGPNWEYEVGDRAKAESVINPFNEKLKEIATRAGDLTTSDVTAELMGLQKEYQKAQGVLAHNKAREEAYNKLLEEKAKAKATDHRGIFYQEQIDKMREDYNYLPGSTAYYDEVKRIDNVNKIISGIKPSTMQNWVNTSGDWITSFDQYGVTPADVKRTMDAGIEADKQLQEDINTELNWYERKLREAEIDPDTYKMKYYDQDANGKIVEKEGHWKNVYKQGIYNNLYTVALKEAFNRYNTNKSGNPFAVEDYKKKLENGVGLHFEVGAGNVSAKTLEHFGNQAKQLQGQIQQTSEQIANQKGQLAGMLMKLNPNMNTVEANKVVQNWRQFQTVGPDGKLAIDYKKVAEKFGVDPSKMTPQDKADFESTVIDFMANQKALASQVRSQKAYEQRGSVLAEQFAPDIAVDYNKLTSDPLTGIRNRNIQTGPLASQESLNKYIAESVAQGKSRDAVFNELNSIYKDPSLARQVSSEFEKSYQTINEKLKNGEYSLTYHVADGGDWTAINSAYTKALQGSPAMAMEAVVDGKGMDVRTYLKNELGLDDSEIDALNVNSVQTITTTGLDGKPVKMLNLKGEKGSNIRVPIHEPTVDKGSMTEFLVSDLMQYETKSTASKSGGAMELEYKSTQLGEIWAGESLRNEDIYSLDRGQSVTIESGIPNLMINVKATRKGDDFTASAVFPDGTSTDLGAHLADENAVLKKVGELIYRFERNKVR